MVYKACNRLLLTKVQGEELVAQFAKRLLVFATSHITSEALQLEKPAGGERHNWDSSNGKAAMDETAFATLSYYMVSEMVGTLAIVRYNARDDHDRTTAVAEDTLF